MRTNKLLHAKLIDGKPAHILVGQIAGAWTIESSSVDAMLNHVQREIGTLPKMVLLEELGINSATFYKVARGASNLPEGWLLRMSDFSGIPVSELRAIACLPPIVEAHKHARVDFRDDNRKAGLI